MHGRTTRRAAERALCRFGRAVQEFEGQTGTDVYMCEYEYDEQWKVRLRALDTVTLVTLV